jgi:hypothetical protein
MKIVNKPMEPATTDDPIKDEVHKYASTLGPDFEDCATNYFQDEASVKAGVQLQKDAWNAAVDVIVAYINQKNLVQGEVLERFKL